MRRRNWAFFIPTIMAAVLVGAKHWALPKFKLPKLQGKYLVGQINLDLTDIDRLELYKKEEENRRLQITVWYSISKGIGKSLEYPKEVLSALQKVIKLPAWLFTHVGKIKTHCYEEGEAAELQGKSPLIIYSPGNSSTRFQNMAVIEQLVSLGYTVIGVDHPYTSNDIAFEDGTIAYRNLTFEEKDTALYEKEVVIRAEDLAFVLRKIKNNPGLIDETIWRNIDFERIGVLGHSYGGATASWLMSENTDIKAGLSYDGGLWGPITQKGFQKPFLYLSASETLGLRYGADKERADFVESVVQNLKEAYRNSGDNAKAILLENYNHYSFTDLTLFSPLLSKGKKPMETTIDITIAFFEQYLKGNLAEPSLGVLVEEREDLSYLEW